MISSCFFLVSVGSSLCVTVSQQALVRFLSTAMEGTALDWNTDASSNSGHGHLRSRSSPTADELDGRAAKVRRTDAGQQRSALAESELASTLSLVASSVDAAPREQRTTRSVRTLIKPMWKAGLVVATVIWLVFVVWWAAATFSDQIEKVIAWAAWYLLWLARAALLCELLAAWDLIWWERLTFADAVIMMTCAALGIVVCWLLLRQLLFEYFMCAMIYNVGFITATMYNLRTTLGDFSRITLLSNSTICKT